MSLVPSKSGPGAEEELEELGDEVIIAQQQVAHAPPAAAHLAQEKRSVVISDKPPGGVAAPGSSPPRSRASRGEATVVIRDRRKVEAMRRELIESQRAYERRSSRPPRPYLLWGGAALAAFLLGGVVALAFGAMTAPPRGPVPPAPPLDPAADERERAAKAEPSASPAPTVDLEDLPVERRKRR